MRELFKALWDGKLIIILVTVLFTASSIVFALFAQEWWSSDAKVAEAQPRNLSTYQQQVKQFQPVFNIYQDDGTVLVSQELDDLVDVEVLFKRFVNTFGSSNNKRAFLDQNTEFQQLKVATTANASNLTEDEARALYARWFERISASKVDKKDRNSPYTISFQTTTKESSFDLLTSYVSFTESKVREDAFSNLKAFVNSKRNELIQQKRILESQAKNQLLVETERTKYAVEIALAAGVEKPTQIGNDKEIFGIELGSKGLEAKIKALDSLKNLSVIEPRLLQINAKLDMLNNLEIDRTVDFQTFRYLENIEQPITRDKPKRALIVVLGTLLGGMLGVAIVLIRFAFRKED
nr:Wzz/FepE/Etk N-terminal domain-containing protein [Vibrio splendidus]